MFRSCYILLLSFIGLACVQAQTYNYSYQKNKIDFFSVLAFDLGVRSYDRLRSGKQLTSFNQVDIQNLWSIDQSAVGNFSTTSDHISDYLLYTSVLTPLLIKWSDHSDDDSFKNIALMGLQGFFIQDGLVQTTKMIVGRPRPYIYNEGASAINRLLSKTDLKSFPSGHTATTSYFCFFTAKVYSDLFPESKWKSLIWAGAVTMPALTAYLRYDAGKHFPTDLITAYGIGAFFGILVPEFYKNDKLSISAGDSGVIINIKI